MGVGGFYGLGGGGRVGVFMGFCKRFNTGIGYYVSMWVTTSVLQGFLFRAWDLWLLEETVHLGLPGCKV